MNTVQKFSFENDRFNKCGVLKNEKILECDPILHFLHIKLGLPKHAIAIIFILFSPATLIIWAMITGVWSNANNPTLIYPLFASYTTWIGDIVLAVSIAFILMYYQNIAEAFNSLKQNGILTKNITSYDQFLLKKSQCYSRCKKNIIQKTLSFTISFLIACGLHYSFLLDNKFGWTELSSTGGFSFLGYYHIIVMTIYLFILLNFTVNLLKTKNLIRSVKDSFLSKENNPELIRLCPFDSGGLHSFSKLAFSAFRAFSMVGVYIAVLLFTLIRVRKTFGEFHMWSILELSFTPIYLYFAPFLLYMHLKPIHEFMHEFKYDLMGELISIERSKGSLSRGCLNKMVACKANREHLEATDAIFNMIKKFPTWPLRKSSLKYLFEYLLIGVGQLVVGILAL